MAELFILLGLASPFILMVWMWRAMRKASARAIEKNTPEAVHHRFETDDVVSEQGGLQSSRRNVPDDALAEPDSTGGEFAGIRAIQGRR